MAFWITAFHVTEAERPEATYQMIKARLQKEVSEVFRLEVPLGLTFRSFDSLIKLVDELSKFDSQVEATLRRVEKLLAELTNRPEYSVVSQRQNYTWRRYLQEFHWDDAKFPKQRSIADNLALMANTVTKLDDEVRVKTAHLAELRTALSSVAGKEAVSLASRDLLDVLTPSRVNPADFVETPHLCTVAVVVPRGMDKDFLGSYESWENFVVPATAKKLEGIEDKDGNTVWRVVLFRSAVEGFRAAGRARRITVREFSFSAERFEEHNRARKRIEAEVQKQEQFVKLLCKGAFSDTFVSWMHVKVMRTFVEAVLRFGVGKDGSPRFVALILKPKTASKLAPLRSALASFASSPGMGENTDGDKVDDEGEFYPYVYLPFTPLLEESQK